MTTAEIEGTVPAIYAKVLAVRTALPRIAKNGTGPQTQGSYKFLSVDDILEAVRPLEIENGIISYPVDHEVTFHFNTAADKQDGRVPKENVQGLVDFTFRYVAVSDGSYIDVSAPGEGIDSQDKATRKATTQAQKIANILLYNIITGEPDPDAQDGGAEAQTGAPATTTAANRRVDAARQATQPAAGGAANEVQALNERIRVWIGNDDDRRTAVNEMLSEAKANGVAATQARKRAIDTLGID